MSNLEKIINYKNHLMKLDIQMFSNFISEHSTYFQISQSNSPNSYYDARPYFKFFYDTDQNTGVTTYTMEVYSQEYRSEGDGSTIYYNINAVIAGQSFNRTGSYWSSGTGYRLTHLFTVQKQVASTSDGTGVQINYGINGQANTNYGARSSGGGWYFAPPSVQFNAKIGQVSNFTIGEDFVVPVTINDSSKTHTLKIKIGNTQVATRTITQASTTITFSNSELTAIYNASTTTNTPTFTFDLLTFNGQTQVGSTSSTTAIGTITNANPTISNVTYASSTNTLGGENIISGVSNVTITCQASGQKSATISNVKVNGQEMTLSNGTYSITLNAQTTGTFNIVATDSRGNTVTQTVTKTVVNYVPLTITGTLKRTSQTSGEVKANLTGNYFNGAFKTNTNNTLSISWKYRERGSSTWINGTSITPTITNNTFSISNVSLNTLLQQTSSFFDYTKNYEFQITAEDRLNQIVIVILVNKGIPIMSWHELYAVVNGDFDVRGNYLQNGQPLPTSNPLDAYPVGSIYISEESTSPASLFGGTWVKITGRFLYGVDADNKLKTTGGSEKQSHKYGLTSAGYYRNAGFVEDTDAGLLNYDTNNNTSLANINSNNVTKQGGINNAVQTSTKYVNQAYYTATAQTSYESIIPPYYGVYIWRRLPDA